MAERLNKFLSECGAGSRRKVEELIIQGRVDVNGRTVTELSLKVDPEHDKIFLDGQRMKLKDKVYYLLNKPKGFITTTSDEKGRRTVVDLIRTNENIFPVGRLDYNTTGVLLLTNDGDFSNLLTHPSHKVPRIYKATLNVPLREEDEEKLKKAIYLDGRKGKFEEIEFPKKKNRSIVNVKTVEGRNHFVKNMFKALGYFVNELERLNYAGITADDMPHGSYRQLTKEEISSIRKIYQKG